MSDVTTAQEGTLPQGQSSPESQGETSTQPRTITLEEHQAALNRLSDKLADAGRKHKSEVESINAQIAEAQKREAGLLAQMDELEDSKATTPDTKQIVAIKRELRRRDAELATLQANLTREKQAWESERTELQQLKVLRKAQAIAKGFEGVDPEDLVTLTDGTEERMEALAKRLGKPKWEQPKATGGTTPISEKGAGGMSDEAFWAWAAEPGRNLSGADAKRLKAIRDKKLNGG
jgi:chromosome segregation ATPase